MATQKHKPVASGHEMLQEERYLWMARAFVMMTVLGALANVALLLALSGTIPFLRVQPFYLQVQDKDDQVIAVERPSAELVKDDLLEENLIRQYVLAYFSVTSNIEELQRRWGVDGIINWMSEESVFREFSQRAVKALQMAQEDNFTRDVRVLVANRLLHQGEGDIWRVELEFRDMAQDYEQVAVSKYEVTLAVSFKPTRSGLKWSQRLKNPLGFVVSRVGTKRMDS